MSTTRRRLLALGLGVLLAGGGLLALELGARVLEAQRVPSYETATGVEPAVMPPHPYLLWERTPGTGDELGVPVRINSLGIRGPEPAVPKPAELRRVVAVGDSSVYGFGVPEHARFVDVAIDRIGGPGLEAWAAAVPGYSTLQLRNLLELRGHLLEPDLLVLACLWSDHATARMEDAALLDRYQRWAQGAGGALAASAITRLLRWELDVRRGSQATHRADYSPEDHYPHHGVTRVPVPDYRANLEALAALAAHHDADIAVLVLPHPDDLDGGGGPEDRYDGHRRALRGLAEAHGAPLVDGPTVFADAATTNPNLDAEDLFLDNIHPSVRGHRLLGEALAQALADWERRTRP